VRKGLKRELGELGKEREEKEEEGNLGEKRMLGFEDMREAQGAEEAMGEWESERVSVDRIEWTTEKAVFI